MGPALGEDMRLTAKRIAKLRKRPRGKPYPDGHGLHLQVKSLNAASWLFRYERNGRDRWMGLGPLHTVSLAEARARAKQARLGLLDGIDPIEARRAAKAAKALEAAKAVTFEQAAEADSKAHESAMAQREAPSEFVGSLRTYAYPAIGKLPVRAIDTGLVLKVLQPLWKRVPETASRVRGGGDPRRFSTMPRCATCARALTRCVEGTPRAPAAPAECHHHQASRGLALRRAAELHARTWAA